MDEENRDDSSFRVTDRRHFTAEGELRPGREEAPPEKDAPAPPHPPAREESAAEKSEQVDESAFASFLLSLATTGMMHLGEVPEPATGRKMENLEAARQMIDILAVLQDKTRGNLSGEESRLLEGLIYELRMKFVEKSQAIKL